MLYSKKKKSWTPNMILSPLKKIKIKIKDQVETIKMSSNNSKNISNKNKTKSNNKKWSNNSTKGLLNNN